MARENRTEAPTPRRRQEARRRGQVARSVEVNSAAVLLAAFGVLSVSGGSMAVGLGWFMKDFLARALVRGDLSPEDVCIGGLEVLLTVGKVAGPVVAASVLAGLVANLAQVGLVTTWEPLVPRLVRLDPAAGLARLFSRRAFMELGKSCVKVAVVGLSGYATLKGVYPMCIAAAYMELPVMLSTMGRLAIQLGLRIGGMLAAIAAVDYLYQRKELQDNLKMTREEVREELRQAEGDPLLRARIRARQRQIAAYRMMAEVPKADVVVTNPVHLAVALKYDSETMGAPKVIAKGARLLAGRIREAALANNVPIVQNQPLAQALYKAVEVGQEIPAHLYKAVAEVLAYVYHLSRGGGGRRANEWGRT